MNIPGSILTMLFGIAITLISLWYGQNNGLMPVAASAEASSVDSLFQLMLTISFGLTLLVQGVLVISFFKFRRRPGDNSDGPPIHGNLSLEILWTAIPAVTVLAVGIYSFEIYNAMGGLDPMVSGQHSMEAHAKMRGSAIAAPLPGENGATPPTERSQIALGIGARPDELGQNADVVVDVSGLQYAWLFNYADSGVMAGELHVPVGEDVQLNITAQDVIHAFWLPELRLKQDAIPGMTTELRFKTTKVGTYAIVCAELCGGYHGGMRTQMIVQTPEDYQAWVQENAVAQNPDLAETLAVKPAELSNSEFLAPYAEEMGVNEELLAQIQTEVHPQ